MLQELLGVFINIFAARDEKCNCTSLVQHDINTSEARPICLHPHCLPFSRRAVVEQKIKEMLKVGVINAVTQKDLYAALT